MHGAQARTLENKAKELRVGSIFRSWRAKTNEPEDQKVIFIKLDLMSFEAMSSSNRGNMDFYSSRGNTGSRTIAKSKASVSATLTISCWLAAALLSRSGTSLADNMPRNVQSFETGFKPTFGSFNMEISDEGRSVSLVLNQKSGSGFRSKDSYLYGSFGTRMKLVPANSAGVVVSFYLSSETTNHDEIDFEFLGNVSGQPWILQTNVFAGGIGGREERMYLWFDPAEEDHSYWVVWNHKQIVFYVDEVPIRVYKNNEQHLGVPYPKYQPMMLFSSIFEASDWATRNGQDKINWSGAPFIASYEKFEINACKVNADQLERMEECQDGEHLKYWWEVGDYQSLSLHQKMQLSYARRNYIVYDYCTDTTRYSPVPQECSINNDY